MQTALHGNALGISPAAKRAPRDSSLDAHANINSSRSARANTSRTNKSANNNGSRHIAQNAITGPSAQFFARIQNLLHGPSGSPRDFTNLYRSQQREASSLMRTANCGSHLDSVRKELEIVKPVPRVQSRERRELACRSEAKLGGAVVAGGKKSGILRPVGSANKLKAQGRLSDGKSSKAAKNVRLRARVPRENTQKSLAELSAEPVVVKRTLGKNPEYFELNQGRTIDLTASVAKSPSTKSLLKATLDVSKFLSTMRGKENNSSRLYSSILKGGAAVSPTRSKAIATAVYFMRSDNESRKSATKAFSHKK